MHHFIYLLFIYLFFYLLITIYGIQKKEAKGWNARVQDPILKQIINGTKKNFDTSYITVAINIRYYNKKNI